MFWLITGGGGEGLAFHFDLRPTLAKKGGDLARRARHSMKLTESTISTKT